MGELDEAALRRLPGLLAKQVALLKMGEGDEPTTTRYTIS
jgi:hypothetical protein